MYHHATITITLSLTRAEGNVLSQTFLLPWDCEGGEARVPPALGGNPNGGSDHANGKEIRMIQMRDSYWQKIGNRMHNDSSVRFTFKCNGNCVCP